MNQSIINFGTMHIILRMTTMLSQNDNYALLVVHKVAAGCCRRQCSRGGRWPVSLTLTTRALTRCGRRGGGWPVWLMRAQDCEPKTSMCFPCILIVSFPPTSVASAPPLASPSVGFDLGATNNSLSRAGAKTKLDLDVRLGARSCEVRTD
jgi:hypothetical protein